MPDQRSLLRGRLATAIDGVADVAAQLHPPAARTGAPPPPPAPAGRAWTAAAAMEPVASVVVERVATAHALPPLMPPDVAPPMAPLEHHRFRAAIIGSGLIGVALMLVVGLRLLGGSPNAPTAAPAQIALTAVRPVASSAGAGVIPPTQVSFPAGTASVSVEVNAAAKQAPVEIVVRVGNPAQTIIDHTYVLASTGATLIALTPGAGSYPPGDYTVTINDDGAIVGATAFEVR